LFLLLLAVFLFPIGVYCGVLGLINRRLRPLRVNGAWDFVGVLFASSGFLLVVAPAVLSGQYQRNLFEFSFGKPSPGQTLHDIWAFWWGIWVIYYLTILGGGAFLLWWRGRSTVVYNVDPEEFERVFLEALERVGLGASRVGNRFTLQVASPVPVPVGIDDTAIAATPLAAPRPAPAPALLGPGDTATVEVDAFPALFNVTLNWRVFRPELRAEVERELGRALAKLETPENGTATWFLSISTSLFLLIFLALGAIIFGSLLTRR
jgi:hypothetical protein